jgi:transcriptional antiterminator Rof (Rho-off)
MGCEEDNDDFEMLRCCRYTILEFACHSNKSREIHILAELHDGSAQGKGAELGRHRTGIIAAVL